MNKLQRNQLKHKKFKRRLKMYNLWEKGKGLKKYHKFKNTSKPCSCFICKKTRYNRNKKHKNE